MRYKEAQKLYDRLECYASTQSVLATGADDALSGEWSKVTLEGT